MSLQKDPEGMETRYLGREADLTGKRVLEIGCGDGRLTWRYVQAAGRTVGIDPKLTALRTAAEECLVDLQKAVSFLGASSTDLPFSNTSFDRAILAWSF